MALSQGQNAIKHGCENANTGLWLLGRGRITNTHCVPLGPMTGECSGCQPADKERTNKPCLSHWGRLHHNSASLPTSILCASWTKHRRLQFQILTHNLKFENLIFIILTFVPMTTMTFISPLLAWLASSDWRWTSIMYCLSLIHIWRCRRRG